jgi:hypothetical protein
METCTDCGAVMAALNGGGSWGRAHRKLASLKNALETFQVASDAHFAALNGWRKP